MEQEQESEVARGSRETLKLKDLFRRLEPGESMPPPSAELSEWSHMLAYGLTFGMLFGLHRGWKMTQDPKAPTPPEIKHAYQRASYFLSKNSLLWGTRFGLFVSLFSAVDIWSRHFEIGEWFEKGLGGGTVSGLFATLRFGLGRWAGLGSMVGGGVGSALGFVQQNLKDVIGDQSEITFGSSGQIHETDSEEETKTDVTAVIEALEQNMLENPAKRLT